MTSKEKEQQAKFNLLFSATIIFLSIVMIVLLWGQSRASEVRVADLELVEKPFDEWIAEQEGTPPPVETSYHYKEEQPWTVWNKIWFGSAIVGQAADIGYSFTKTLPVSVRSGSGSHSTTRRQTTHDTARFLNLHRHK